MDFTIKLSVLDELTYYQSQFNFLYGAGKSD